MRTLKLNLYNIGFTNINIGKELRKSYSDITYNGVTYIGDRNTRKYYKKEDYDRIILKNTNGKYYTEDTEKYFDSNDNLYYTQDTNERYESSDDLYYTQDTNERYESSDDLYYTQDTNERYESSDDLYYAVDICEWYESNYYLYYDENSGDRYEDRDNAPYNEDRPGHNGGNYGDLSNGATICIGLEIEKEKWLEDTSNLIQWGINDDGSVNGGEYTTPILDIEKAINYLSNPDFTELYDLGGGSRCGGHIHISHKGYKTNIEFYDTIKEYRPILWALYPERARGYYSDKNNYITDRYRDINITNSKTVEVRIFPEVENFEQIKFRISLLKFFITNPCSSKEEALDIINKKSMDFISILDISYSTIERKEEILGRIIKAYEIDTTKEKEIISYLGEQCKRLGK